jgi:DNA helicase II / ATP-dependent DNA helicase PcrA
LLENPDVLAEYHARFRYILVDEYQDTNVVQYLWLRLLAQGSPNICCVGDDDQSIYGWRGAEVDNILRFDKDFPGAVVIKLERNYRSTGHILATASSVIAQNKGRLGKTLFTDDELGEKVTVTGVWDDEEEARGIGSDIEAFAKDGHKLNSIAILVRASFQMRSIEDRFVTLGLPYRVIGGPRFYERQEIKDAIAYLEVVANPANDLKFERIVNVPKRGLGDTTVKRIHELGRASNVPMFQAARMMCESDELTGKTRRSLHDLIRQFEIWRTKSLELRHTELAELILDESGYTAMWQADKSPQAQSRLENLKELLRFMHQFENLAGFLEHVSLVMDVDNGDDGDRVSLMTMHAAKGLEFDTVFLPGWEEGLFPSQRSMDESGLKGLEEERRLAYVGITRAKLRSKISFAQNRRNRGLFSAAIPSRFVDELPEEHVEVIEAKSPFGGAYQNFGGNFGGGAVQNYGGGRTSRFDQSTPADVPFSAGYQTPGWQRAQQNWSKDAAAKAAATKQGTRTPGRSRLIEGELVASSSAAGGQFAVGDRVFHQKFGYGRISDIEGNKLTVDFEKAGSKRVVDSFVEKH